MLIGQDGPGEVLVDNWTYRLTAGATQLVADLTQHGFRLGTRFCHYAVPKLSITAVQSRALRILTIEGARPIAARASDPEHNAGDRRLASSRLLSVREQGQGVGYTTLFCVTRGHAYPFVMVAKPRLPLSTTGPFHTNARGLQISKSDYCVTWRLLFAYVDEHTSR